MHVSDQISFFMSQNKSPNWKNYGIEFLSVFIAVIAAFALNNWNDTVKSEKAESKILETIKDGLGKDIEDIQTNIYGHKMGIAACQFFRDILLENPRSLDSLEIYYYTVTRDFVSIQNTSGYETLKSKGLELIQTDSLRTEIISLYEFDYTILRKLEEDYDEMQFHTSFFKEFNQVFAPHFEFSDRGKIIGIDLPLEIDNYNKKIVLTYLHKIYGNRKYIMRHYDEVESKINRLQNNIVKEMKRLKS